jgi:hypothetical protein
MLDDRGGFYMQYQRTSQSGIATAVKATVGALLLLAVLSFMLSSTMFAQDVGTVTGTVYDQSGAVIPKATVTLTNEASKDERKSTSNDVGYFSFGSVPPGSYTIRISYTGFKSWQASGLTVLQGDLRNVSDIALQIGKSDETVAVEAVYSEIAPVDSGERSATLTNKQIQNLSLEGRDATELIRTLPGFSSFNGGGIGNQGQDFTVISPTGGAVGQGVVAGGAPYRGGTDLISDGAHIIDNGCNCGATQTVNGDMVSEVKVQTSNFGADSAKGPVVVNAIGKSGGTEYHGEVYMHARDNSLNSLDWSFGHLLNGPANSNGLIKAPASRFLYPGGQIGGPVPHTNKKLVFWSGFEYYYQNQLPLGGLTTSGLLTDTVPTASMRQGIFDINPAVAADNATMCGPGSANAGNAFCSDTFDSGGTQANFNWSVPTLTPGGNPNTNIPVADFNPGSAVLLSHIPMPNADPSKTGGYNLLVPENINQNGYMFRTRADYSFSDNTKFYVTYNTQKETDSAPVHLWWQPYNSIPFPGGMSSKDNSQTISGHFLHVFSPTLTNDFSTALGYINYPLTQDGSGWTDSSYPYKGVFPTKSTWMPDIGDGYWIAGMPQMIQPDIFTNGGHFVWEKWNYSLEDSMTKSYKTHTIKAGFYWEKTTNNQGAFSDYNGHYETQIGFSGAVPFTGCNNTSGVNTIYCGSNNPVANFLLGVGSFDQVNKYSLDNAWYPTYSVYLLDDWKAAKRLTVNLGLRLDHLGAWRSTDPDGVGSYTGTFSNTYENSISGLPGFSWNGIDPSIPITGRNIPVLTFEPRFGLAYDLRGNGKTVIRGGYGLYGYRDQWNDYAGPIDTAQFVRQYNSSGPVTLDYMSSLYGTINPSGCATGGCGNSSGFAVDDHAQPVSRNYNLTVSQQLPFSSLLEVAYVGSQGRNGPIEGNTNNVDARNLNVVQQGGIFAYRGCTTPLSPTAIFNPTLFGVGSTVNACDTNESSGTDNGAYPLNSLYGANIVNVERHIAIANYNALQTSWVRQKGRVTYNLNYTWSKVLGTQGTAQLNGLAPSALNLNNDYGLLSIDRSHVFNFSYTFQTGNPIKGNRVLEYAVNGWNISGITTWQSGPDITTLSDTNLQLNGNGPQYDTCNPTCSGTTFGTYGIGATNWVGTNNVSLQPTVTCNPTANLKAHQYFNANCFSVPQGGQQGDWQLPYIHGPAYFNSDLAVFKTFKITERQNVEFRLSGFNFLNHPLDSFQGNNDNKLSFNYTCSGGGPCVNGAGSYVLSNTFSTPYVLGTSNAQPGYASTRYGRRVLELSAKYSF